MPDRVKLTLEAYYGFYEGDCRSWDTEYVEVQLSFDPRKSTEMTPEQTVELERAVEDAVHARCGKTDEIAFAGVFHIPREICSECGGFLNIIGECPTCEEKWTTEEVLALKAQQSVGR